MNLFIIIKEPPDGTKDIQIEYDKKAKDIINQISEMDGYGKVSHLPSTNVISVVNNWTANKLFTNLEKLKQNPNFSNYLLHFEYDPLEELEEAIKSHDFFKAYSLGSTLFESYGKKILAKYFHNIDLHIMHGKIERMNLQTVLLMLYTHKVIDKEFYLELTEIIKIRNKLIIHADITKAFGVNMWKQTSNFINKTVICASKLKTIYASM